MRTGSVWANISRTKSAATPEHLPNITACTDRSLQPEAQQRNDSVTACPSDSGTIDSVARSRARESRLHTTSRSDAAGETRALDASADSRRACKERVRWHAPVRSRRSQSPHAPSQSMRPVHAMRPTSGPWSCSGPAPTTHDATSRREARCGAPTVHRWKRAFRSPPIRCLRR